MGKATIDFIVEFVFYGLVWFLASFFVFVFVGVIYQKKSGVKLGKSLKAVVIIGVMSAPIGAVLAYSLCASYNKREINEFDYDYIKDELKAIESKELQKEFELYYADRVINIWEYSRLKYSIAKHGDEKKKAEQKNNIEHVKKQLDAMKTGASVPPHTLIDPNQEN